MSLRRPSLGRLRLPAALALMTTQCVLLGVQPAASAAQRFGPLSHKRATETRQAKLVRACLRRAHLAHITSSNDSLWVAWDPKAYGFVYVQKYASAKAALAQARLIKAEESGVAGRLGISQHIAPYKGSPVPVIVRCLGGRMISKRPAKSPGRFTF